MSKLTQPKTLVRGDDKFVSTKGYAISKNGNDEWVEWLKKYLTVKPAVNPEAPSGAASAFPVYRENSKKIYLPISLGFKLFGAPPVYNYTLPQGDTCDLLEFKGTLRPEQQHPVATFLEAASCPAAGKRGGIISLACAAGKTVLALYIIASLKRKAIVVCHKEFLINQWRERIAMFIPQARVGLIKGKVTDVKDKDIILASLQSLSMKEYPVDTFAGIGTAVFDEAHHLGAEVFSQAMPKLTCEVMLGLSATLNRSDGLRRVFEWYLGKPTVQGIKKRTDTNMTIHMVQYYDPHPDFGRELLMYNNKRNIPRMMGNITKFDPRNEMIIDLLEEVLRKEPGRKSLILSHRRVHLAQLEVILLDRNLGSIGYYVGGMKEADLKASETKDIMLGTYTMISEGFDVPALNTLVLATPISNVEQSIGRIQRQKPEDRKFIPYVIDIWDTFSIFNNQGYKRLRFYKSNGYNITPNIEIETERDNTNLKYSFIEDDD